jgi:hypothetical protein
MKKLLLSLLVITFLSCTPEQNSVPSAEFQKTLSILDGDLLSFKDEASFIKEYSTLSEMKDSQEIKEWISKKKHISLLNTSFIDEELKDSIIGNNRIILSDALKAILNKDSKFKVNGKVIWLYENNFYILSGKDLTINVQDLILRKNKLEIYGDISNGLNSKSNLTNKISIPAVNGSSVTYINDGPNSKRYYLIIFNESIQLNGSFVSKMYLKSIMQYRSCSFWRCTWKEDTSTRRILNVNVIIDPGWSKSNINSTYVVGTQTLLLSTLELYGPIGTAFKMSGTIITYGFNGYNWAQTF